MARGVRGRHRRSPRHRAGRPSSAAARSRRHPGRRAAGSRRPPLLREDPVQRDVLIPELVEVCLAKESLLPKAEAFGDRAAPRVPHGHGERHAVAPDGREQMIDKRGARAGHVPPALMRRTDPVAERVVAGDRVGLGADDTDEVTIDDDPERIEEIVGLGLLDERAGRVDGRRLGPEHPRAKSFAIDLDDHLEEIGIRWIETSKLETVAGIEERATHVAAVVAAFCRSSSASTRRRTLPTIVSGRPSRISICLGDRYAVSPFAGSRAHCWISSTVAVSPSRSTTKAFTASPVLSSGTPITATFEIFGWRYRASSTSLGYTLNPETMIISFNRSTILK